MAHSNDIHAKVYQLMLSCGEDDAREIFRQIRNGQEPVKILEFAASHPTIKNALDPKRLTFPEH